MVRKAMRYYVRDSERSNADGNALADRVARLIDHINRRSEPKLDDILKSRGARRCTADEFDALFGDLPTDDDE